MRTLLLAIAMLAGCASGGGRLGGGEWRAVDINGAPVLAGEAVTLRLDSDDRVSGNTGCNLYSGSYQLSSRQGIRFSAVASTRRACDAAVMDQERRYLAILENVQAYSLYGDGSLSVIAGDGRAIRFRRSGRR